NEHPYGSRNLVLSADGQRLFWNSYIYDTNLTELGGLGTEIYACSTNGQIAFGAQQAFDTRSLQAISSLPVNTSVQAVDRLNRRLWYFNSATHQLGNLAMTVIQQPTITQQPAPLTAVAQGANIYLNVTAMGQSPLSYQWQLGGVNLAGQTNYFLSLNNLQPVQQGNYQVVVSTPFGAVTSAVAQVVVVVPPAIVQAPLGTNVWAGQSFGLTVAASGTAPLAYQWQFENLNLAGATNAALIVNNAQSANEGIYRVVVQNAAGVVTSSVALVRVNPAAPAISAGPLAATVPAATNVTFGVTATGSQPMTYQWLFNGSWLAGATGTSLLLTNVQAWHGGAYQVVVANGFGSVTSPPAALTVLPVVPYFVVQPVGANLPGGSNWTMNAQARGSEPISYFWIHDGLTVAGAFQSTLTLSNLKVTDGGNYALVAFNTTGSTTSQLASITVTAAPPVFVQQPVSTNALQGATITFNSLASGSNPLRYQWYFQAGPLVGQTNRTLTLASVTTNASGSYVVTVSNLFGVATSSVATLNVNQAPVLLQPLSNVVVD
ncbi:MAG TPA: immunoglobulin domain-containing protein, partial [Verrucomicrobiae bacterium]